MVPTVATVPVAYLKGIVVINELVSDPEEQEEWVELWNVHETVPGRMDACRRRTHHCLKGMQVAPPAMHHLADSGESQQRLGLDDSSRPQ